MLVGLSQVSYDIVHKCGASPQSWPGWHLEFQECDSTIYHDGLFTNS